MTSTWYDVQCLSTPEVLLYLVFGGMHVMPRKWPLGLTSQCPDTIRRVFGRLHASQWMTVLDTVSFLSNSLSLDYGSVEEHLCSDEVDPANVILRFSLIF